MQIYLKCFTVAVYSYASPKTSIQGLWFGTLILGKQGGSNLEFLTTDWTGTPSVRNHKVLRFVDDFDASVKRRICEFEMYNFKSNSWKVVNVTADWDIEFYHRGLSLKGNTYWFAQDKVPIGPAVLEISDLPDFLLSFDFTTERFGPRLPLPFHSFYEDTVTLSSVREKQLAVLFQQCGAFKVKIWITTKIEPNAVSWCKFLSVDMKPLTGCQFDINAGSFFFVAVVLDKNIGKLGDYTGNIAYIIGKKGYFKKVDLGESNCCPLVCSYVPTSLQITP